VAAFVLAGELTAKLLTASIASYAIFLFLPLIGQFIGLNFNDSASLNIFTLLLTCLAAVAALLITEKKIASSFSSPLIGGVAALASAYLIAFLSEDSLEGIVAIYFSPQYFLAVCGSAVIAAALSYLIKAEKIPELKKETRIEEISEKEKPKVEMINCPYCGRQIPVDSIFCPLCGGRIGEEEER